MTGIKSYKEKETEKHRGKKRFIERQAEDVEAEREIKEFVQAPIEHPDNDKEPSID